MQSISTTARRRWLPVLTIGMCEAISGKGQTPSTIASISAADAAIPARISVGRTISAAAHSGRVSAPAYRARTCVKSGPIET
jgi:hypothetical protein